MERGRLFGVSEGVDPLLGVKMSALRFCRNCNNLLTARENKQMQELLLTCKSCRYQEVVQEIEKSDVSQYTIYRQNFKAAVETKLDSINPEVTKDPTLPRSYQVTCAKCNGCEAVFFRTEVTSKDTSLKLVFVCCHCGHKWIR